MQKDIHKKVVNISLPAIDDVLSFSFECWKSMSTTRARTAKRTAVTWGFFLSTVARENIEMLSTVLEIYNFSSFLFEHSSHF